MKEVKHFACEICGTEYKDKERATECECSHIKPIGIKKARYFSYKNDKSGYLIKVDIEMENGEVLSYKR